MFGVDQSLPPTQKEKKNNNKVRPVCMVLLSVSTHHAPHRTSRVGSPWARNTPDCANTHVHPHSSGDTDGASMSRCQADLSGTRMGRHQAALSCRRRRLRCAMPDEGAHDTKQA